MGRILLYRGFDIAAISFIYPFVWMIGASFAPMSEIAGMVIWPIHPGWGNFRSMIEKIPILHSLMNQFDAGIDYNFTGIDHRINGWICIGKNAIHGKADDILCDCFYHVTAISDYPYPELYNDGEFAPGGHFSGAYSAVCCKCICDADVPAGFSGSAAGIDRRSPDGWLQ